MHLDPKFEMIVLVAGWILYFTLHSVLAAEKIKSKFKPTLYRLFYVLFSTAGLFVLLFYDASIDSLKFFVNQGPVRWASLILTIFGVMIIQTAFRQFNLKGFVGLAEEKKELQTHGILGYIRHPIQAGIILIVLGFFLFLPNLPTLLSCLCVLIYIPIGIYFEEKKLVAAFGDQYLEYRKKVPAIIPEQLLSRL